MPETPACVTKVTSILAFKLGTTTTICYCRPGNILSEKSQTPLVALVVDDSMLIRHTVCRFLEDRGYSVESATNGEEALPIVSRIRPDIIVTDMQMPRMSGAELITALKGQPETADIPIVIVAGKNSGFTAQENRANFIIFKDIDIEYQLAKALEALLGSGVTKVKAAGK